jgi:hypothetical protein
VPQLQRSYPHVWFTVRCPADPASAAAMVAIYRLFFVLLSALAVRARGVDRPPHIIFCLVDGANAPLVPYQSGGHVTVSCQLTHSSGPSANE